MKYPPVSAESVSCVGGFMAHNKVDDERIENTDYVFRKAGYLRGALLLRTGDDTRSPTAIMFRVIIHRSLRSQYLGGFANTRGSAQEQGEKKHNSNPATDRSIKTDRQLE
jgi:hypothetical protein